MKNSKLIGLLESFSAEELQELDKFLMSPYFNRNPLYSKLLLVFIKNKEAISESKDMKELFFSAAFPKQKYDDLKLRHAFSDFLELIETFLAIRDLQSDEDGKKLKVLRYYETKGLGKHFAATQRKVFPSDVVQHPTNENALLFAYQANSVLNDFTIRENIRQGKHNLRETMYSIDRFYLFTKLRLLCEIINYRNIIAIDFDLPFFDEIIPLLEKSPYSEVPAIGIYRDILLTLTDGNEEHYYSLKAHLEQYSHLFTKDESKGMHFYALNYCVKKINAGQTNYIGEIFEFYKRMLDNELLIEDGYLMHSQYKNIVVAALRHGEHAWTLDFIERYKSKIEEKHRSNAYTYNLAKYYFYIKDYERVIRLLNKVEYEDIFYNLDSKTLLLKTYFECREVKSLFSLLDSFKTYLNRNKLISATHKEVYTNLLYFTKKLMDINPGQKQKIEKYKAELKSTDAIADVNWLEEKLVELEE